MTQHIFFHPFIVTVTVAQCPQNKLFSVIVCIITAINSLLFTLEVNDSYPCWRYSHVEKLNPTALPLLQINIKQIFHRKFYHIIYRLTILYGASVTQVSVSYLVDNIRTNAFICTCILPCGLHYSQSCYYRKWATSQITQQSYGAMVQINTMKNVLTL